DRVKLVRRCIVDDLAGGAVQFRHTERSVERAVRIQAVDPPGDRTTDSEHYLSVGQKSTSSDTVAARNSGIKRRVHSEIGIKTRDAPPCEAADKVEGADD